MRIIIECPERILHLEAGYIYADRPSSTSTLLQSGGGPYIFASYRDGSEAAFRNAVKPAEISEADVFELRKNFQAVISQVQAR